jgi:hypothetical protein
LQFDVDEAGRLACRSSVGIDGAVVAASFGSLPRLYPVVRGSNGLMVMTAHEQKRRERFGRRLQEEEA